MVLQAMVFIATTTSRSNTLAITRNGVIYSCLAGLAIGLYGIVLMRIFQRGSLVYITPIVYGGTIALSSMAGWLLFGVRVSPLQIAGVVLVVTGIILVGLSKAH